MSGFTGSGDYGAQAKRMLAVRALKAEGAQFERIVAWLASLRLLHGVPSWYLVPDGRMLPAESIKFFLVDENWISCLIDGAFSIGSSTAGDRERDKGILPDLMARIADKARNVRQEKLGAPGRASEGKASGTSGSGFLLRSGVVSGWPGMRVHGWAAGELAIKTRFEAVAQDILLCLFDRQVDKVTFSEPAELLHFGVDQPESSSTTYTKTLRYVKSSNGDNAPGKQMNANVNVAMSPKRVVDIHGLATAIQSTLVKNDGLGSTDSYTSAEFALELIEGVQQVTFQLGAEEAT